MTGNDRLSEDQALLAAEYALGVLDRAGLAEARALAATSEAFRTELARWSGRLSPLFDDAAPIVPPAHMWPRIEMSIGGLTGPNANVVQLQRRVATWRGISGALFALAASLAIVLLVHPLGNGPSRVETTPRSVAPPLVAMIGDDKQMKLVASWDPAGRRLVLAVAGDMPADPSHAHELWIIPTGGKPRSLGTMGADKQMHMSLEQTLAELMRQGATIAISVEPPGGSVTGAPTGPVIASGELRTA